MPDPRRLAEQLTDLGGQWNVVESTAQGTGAASGQLVVVANPLRFGLVMGITGQNISGNTFVTTLQYAAAGTGIILNSSCPSLWLSYREYGALVQQAWYAQTSTIGAIIEVIEILLVQ